MVEFGMRRYLLFSLLLFLILELRSSVVVLGGIFSYVDINGDGYTDLIVGDGSGGLSIRVASDDKDHTFHEDQRFAVRHFPPNGTVITNVAVGDFDGDSFPDLAVSLAPIPFDDGVSAPPNPPCENAQLLRICYGRAEGFECVDATYDNHENNETETSWFCEQPLLLDCDSGSGENEGRTTDLLTVIPNNANAGGRGRFACLLASQRRGHFSVMPDFPPDDPAPVPARSPAFNAFVDITGDLRPEIVLWTEVEDKDKDKQDLLVGLRVYQQRAEGGGSWVRKEGWMPSPPVGSAGHQLLPPTPAKGQSFVLGQSVYDDFNRDGLVDHLIPYCAPDASGQCRSVRFKVWTSNSWTTADLELELVDDQGGRWVIFKRKEGGAQSETFYARSGDYTRDGYPDLLVVLERADKPGDRAAFLLENADCAAGQQCGEWGRTFRVWWRPVAGGAGAGGGSAIGTATFFDLGEDGALNVLVDYDDNATTTTQGQQFAFSGRAYEGDTTFLKVQVFTGSCLDQCRYGREGSAISWPGASLVYASSDEDGRPIKGAYSQRPVASYRSLLLPYALFGLGRTPNFVEKLRVGVPGGGHSSVARTRTWEQLVPNSRIYVIPYPLDRPQSWLHRLYLTPSRLIAYSFVSLSSLCGLIILVAFGLHMHERRQDHKERLQQRDKFHFDAL